MLMQVSPETFALNLMLILGAVILLTIFFFLFIATWTGIRALVWFLKWRYRQREFLRLYRRADGRRYPPFTPGVCQSCGRGDHKIYFPPDGEGLCSICYEQSWPCTDLPHESTHGHPVNG